MGWQIRRSEGAMRTAVDARTAAGGRLTRGMVLYYLAFGIALLRYVLLDVSGVGAALGTAAGAVGMAALIVSSALLVVKSMFQTYRPRDLTIIAFLSAIAVLSYTQSGRAAPIFVLLFIVAGQGVSFRTIARVVVAIVGAAVPVVVSLSLLGVLPNRVSIRGGVARSALGFGHPNVLAILVLTLCAAWIVVRWERLALKDYLFILFLTLLANIPTDSRTSFLVALGLLVVTVLCRHLGAPFVRLTNIAAKVSLLAFPLVSLYMARAFDPTSEAQHGIDQALSGRLTYLSEIVGVHGFSVFGQRVFLGEAGALSGQSFLDNAFGRLAVMHGVALLAALVVGYLLLLRKAISAGRTEIVVCVLAFACIALFEEHFLIVEVNFTLIWLAGVMYGCRELGGAGADSAAPRAGRGETGSV